MKAGEAEKEKMMIKARRLLRERGEKAFKIAKNAILEERIRNEKVCDALHFFMEEAWFDVQHPALLSLSCEAVGGDPDMTIHVGAAMVLLAGSADIHDDIIDKSENKGSRSTVFGKFGKEIALLAGDALLFKGVTSMYEACESLPKNKRQAILNLVRQAFFEIGSAEAMEVGLKEKCDLTPEEYCDLIKMKATVAEASARIGAILGGGTTKEIDLLGRYGKTLGILAIIRDDFIDLYEPDELANRVKNECLPLPLLYAFKDKTKKDRINGLLGRDVITERETNTILDLVMETKEVEVLRKEMRSMFEREQDSLTHLERCKNGLKLLLEATLEDL